MPYTGADDPDLPEDVQEMPKDDREQFVAVFNSAFERCEEEGLSEVADDPDDFADCEAFAFANAYGVVLKEEERMAKDQVVTIDINWSTKVFRKLRDGILEVFAPFVNGKERALSGQSLFNQLWNELEKKDPWVWLNDIYWDDDGSTYVVASSEGKLYRVDFVIDGPVIEVSEEWVEVEPDFKPIEQTRTKIIRQKDGRVRWLSISSTTVLNRSGEIDAAELFDSFIEHAEESGEYPYRTFFHQGEALKTGMTDYMAREGNVYITSGLYDEDCELAEHEIKAFEKEPDYWGESIAFEAHEFELAEVAEGIEIPVYKSGIHIETSTLPKDRACALFTQPMISREVIRMRDEVKEELLRLTDGDEEATEEFAELVDNTNLKIKQEHLITREGDPDPKAEIEPKDEDGDTEPGKSEDPPVEPKVDQAAPVLYDLELDDKAIDRIADIAARSDFNTLALKARDDKIDELQATLDELSEKIDSLTDLPDRVSALELDEDEKRETWLEDQPKKKETTKVTYRPSKDKSDDAEEPSMQDVADETLAALPTH